MADPPRAATALLLSAVLLVSLPGSAAAQTDPWQPSATTGELAYLGFNTLIGAVTAGVLAKVRGEDFSDAAVAGALGGAVVYAGKRTAVLRFPAAGLLGRQVAGVGSSMVRNASYGDGALELLTLSLPLVRLDIDPAARRVTAARLNVAELVALGYTLTRDELVLDWGGSLSSGAPVFEAPHHEIRNDDGGVSGVMASGLILVGGIRSWSYEHVVRHERVHVLQRDFAHVVWTGAVESWLIGLLPAGDRWGRYLDIDFLSRYTSYVAMENEAQFLDDR